MPKTTCRSGDRVPTSASSTDKRRLCLSSTSGHQCWLREFKGLRQVAGTAHAFVRKGFAMQRRSSMQQLPGNRRGHRVCAQPNTRRADARPPGFGKDHRYCPFNRRSTDSMATILERLPLMVRISERSTSIGLCVLALSILVPSLLLRFSQHRVDEQEWSSTRRNTVSTGPVREEVPAVNFLPLNSSSPDNLGRLRENPIDRRSDRSSARHAVQPRKPNEIDLSTQRRNFRADSYAMPLPTRPVPSRKQARGITRLHRQAAPSADISKVPVEEQSKLRAIVAENTSASSAKDSGSLASINANATSSSSQPPPQVNLLQTDIDINGGAPAPIFTTAPRPTSRKQVEDDLHNARMNGSLPRFGNPDPYGPGGSPSEANDKSR